MLQVWRDERADLRRDWVNLSVPHLQKKIFSRRLVTIIPQQKGWIWKPFTKPTKHNFLRVQRMKEKQRRIYIKQRWKPEPREKRKNGWILETRRDGKTFWRIEEFLCCKYINLNNPFFITFNKYHQIQSHNIRWNPLEICIYNFTSTFTIFCRFSVVSNFQYSSVLSFLPFSRVRFSPQVGFRSTDSKILSNDWRQRWKELKN